MRAIAHEIKFSLKNVLRTIWLARDRCVVNHDRTWNYWLSLCPYPLQQDESETKRSVWNRSWIWCGVVHVIRWVDWLGSVFNSNGTRSRSGHSVQLVIYRMCKQIAINYKRCPVLFLAACKWNRPNCDCLLWLQMEMEKERERKKKRNQNSYPIEMSCINVKNCEYSKHATELYFFFATECRRLNQSHIHDAKKRATIKTAFRSGTGTHENAIKSHWTSSELGRDFLYIFFDLLRVCHLDYCDKCDWLSCVICMCEWAVSNDKN